MAFLQLTPSSGPVGDPTCGSVNLYEIFVFSLCDTGRNAENEVVAGIHPWLHPATVLSAVFWQQTAEPQGIRRQFSRTAGVYWQQPWGFFIWGFRVFRYHKGEVGVIYLWRSTSCIYMIDFRIIKRYNAYYHGWCLAFGEHTADYQENRDINWLFGEERIGLILSSGLRKQAQREFLGHHEEIPALTLSDDMVRMNKFIYPLNNDTDRVNARHLKEFLLSSADLHMFLCSHFFYPHTRIITFAKKKPILIMYKGMQPLKLIVE